MRTPIFLGWITRSHEIFDIFNSRLDKLFLVDKEQAKQLTMKAVLRALFSVSLFTLFLFWANVTSAQTNNSTNSPSGSDARPPVVTNAQTPVAVAVSTPAGQSGTNKVGGAQPNSLPRGGAIEEQSINQNSQLNATVSSQLKQTLAELKQELNQLSAADPEYTKVQDAISRIETQLNNQ